MLHAKQPSRQLSLAYDIFLTWLHTYKSDSVEKTVLSHTVWTLDRVYSSHQEKPVSLRHRSRICERALTQKCEQIIKIHRVLIFPLIALTHRVIATRLCERTFTPPRIRREIHTQSSDLPVCVMLMGHARRKCTRYAALMLTLRRVPILVY